MGYVSVPVASFILVALSVVAVAMVIETIWKSKSFKINIDNEGTLSIANIKSLPGVVFRGVVLYYLMQTILFSIVKLDEAMFVSNYNADGRLNPHIVNENLTTDEAGKCKNPNSTIYYNNEYPPLCGIPHNILYSKPLLHFGRLENEQIIVLVGEWPNSQKVALHAIEW